MTLDSAFAHMPTLTTERLLIRQIRKHDAEAIFAFKSDLEVTRRYGQCPHRSIDDTRAWIQRNLDDQKRRLVITWALTLKNNGTAIGECCFWNFDPNYQCAEIGYELLPAYWHKGMMAEALTEVLNYGFTDLGLHRIEASPLATNIPSQKLLLRLGFKIEGTLRQRILFQNRFEDQLYFGLLKEEWMK